MVEHEEENMTERDREVNVVNIVLPNGTAEAVSIRNHGTVFELKVICESQFGIPTRLQELYISETDNNSAGEVELQDWESLENNPEILKMQVPICWNRLVCGALNNEVENVYRRIQFPMQHINREERLFVAMFMACCQGQSKTVARLMGLNIELDLRRFTKTKRSLFHACALSGDIKCLEMIIKDLITTSFDIFNTLDVNKESALQIAKRLGRQTVARTLSRYAKGGEGVDSLARSSTESGIGLSDEEGQEGNPVPHQTPTGNDENVNNTRDLNEAVVTKSKHSSLTNENRDLQVDEDTVRESIVCEKESDESNEDAFYSTGNSTWKNNLSFADGTTVVSDSTFDQRPTSSLSSSSDESDKMRFFSISPIPPVRPQDLPLRPLLGRRREQENADVFSSPRGARVPCISVGDESSEDEDRLPCLEEKQSLTGRTDLKSYFYGKKSPSQIRRSGRDHFRSASSPSSPFSSPRTSPTEENPQSSLGITEVKIAKSAPNSPKINRTHLMRAGAIMGHGRVPVPPNSPSFRPSTRRQSEPFAPAMYAGNAGVRLTSLRKGSLAPQRPDSAMKNLAGQRAKSRSICEVTIKDSLRSYQWMNKNMESGERLERPWNAWIVAKRQDMAALAPTPEERHVSPVPSPGSRRRSFQQWLNDKDMNEMRRMHAEAQVEAQQAAHGGQVKGKSFEEWLEDKHLESLREKEKVKEKEEEQKGQVEMKQRRRRMSQAKYQSWLQEKELKALEEEEKRLGEAKEQLEKMKLKWEEEDEMKKNEMPNGKRPVIRTQSCPTNEPKTAVSRQRFSSLQVKSK